MILSFHSFLSVIAGEQFDIAESIVRERGYVGEYAYGTKIHSKEPLAFVTRDDDPEWSDFVNWVLQALLGAEDEAITQRTANIIAPTTVFGETSPFALAFRNAVREVGNYGEIYRRTLEVLLPRPIPDRINEGDSGLIYSYPFGAIDGVVAAGPALGSTLDEIRTRGFLKCGISRRVIFAQFDTASQTWDGFDVDFCKAISAAIFNGTTSTIVYTDLPASERFVALQNGDVDLLSRLTTVTLSRDIREPATQAGFSFSQPNFYDGLTFGGKLLLDLYNEHCLLGLGRHHLTVPLDQQGFHPLRAAPIDWTSRPSLVAIY
jgi:ABC-type amino acid transport substrate-binding protein